MDWQPRYSLPSKIRITLTEKRPKDKITRANHEDDEARVGVGVPERGNVTERGKVTELLSEEKQHFQRGKKWIPGYMDI